MSAFICRTCGAQYPDTAEPPASCKICTDPRQYVGWDGQRWATLDGLAEEGHRTEAREEEPGLLGIGVEPSLAIGQRSLLVQTPSGNLLWDVPGFVDEAAFAEAERRGGVAVVSASHPHFYGVMIEWARRFDATVLLPRADARWITRPDPSIRHYEDRAEPIEGLSLIRTGGHFPGSAVAHWQAGADGKGVLLTGDTVTVVPDRSWVSFMWSYPNLIPLDAGRISGIVEALAGLEYDRVYGGWWGRVVDREGEEAVRRSAERYLTAISDTGRLEAGGGAG